MVKVNIDTMKQTENIDVYFFLPSVKRPRFLVSSRWCSAAEVDMPGSVRARSSLPSSTPAAELIRLIHVAISS